MISIVSRLSQKCLTFNGATEGIRAEQFSCTGNFNQKFELIHIEENYYTVQAQHSNLYLTVKDDSSVDGTVLVQSNRKLTSNAQLFKFSGFLKLSKEVFIFNKLGNFVLQPLSNDTNGEMGFASFTGSQMQKFQVEFLRQGLFIIKSLYSQKLVETKSTNEGAQVLQVIPDYGDDQMFIFQHISKGWYTIANKLNGKCLTNEDVTSGFIFRTVRKLLVQRTCNVNENQLFKIEFAEALTSAQQPLSKLDQIVLYRPGTGTMWILKNNQEKFNPVYAQGDPGKGIGGYDLKSSADRAFAFDYTHSGKLDHIVLYRPGTGTMWILQNNKNTFTPVYAQGDPGKGIGGYDLKSSSDLAFAFDYEHSTKQDHIVLYRPGTGTMWILKNVGGTFSPVYAQGDPGNGIGGFDLKSKADRAFAFDYDHSGKLDHIVLYRPGTGTMWILKNVGGVFSPVYAQGDPGIGIGGFDLKSKDDQAFAFDYDHNGKQDHIAIYRPGTGTIWILKNTGGVFKPVYAQGDPGNGIGGYDLKSKADRAFAFDYDHSGKLDYIVLYRPGTGTMWILKNNAGIFSPVYHQGDPGNGIGGYDLKSSQDFAFAFSSIWE